MAVFGDVVEISFQVPLPLLTHYLTATDGQGDGDAIQAALKVDAHDRRLIGIGGFDTLAARRNSFASRDLHTV